MKNKIIIGMITLVSVLSVSSFTKSENENQTGSKRPFWGWSEWNCSPNYPCCIRTHYVFWMENGTEVDCD